MILSKARVYLTDQGWTGKGKEQAQIHFYPFLTLLNASDTMVKGTT